MAYLTETDIESELSIDIDNSSQPTTSEVSGFITQIEADLNGTLYSVGVSLPLNETDNPNAWEILTQAALWGVCARVLSSYGGVVMDQGPKEAMYWERFRDKVQQILKDPACLYDATYVSSGSQLGIGGLTDDSDEYYDPTFTMDDKF